MTSRQLIAWSRTHERRAGRWWKSPWLVAIAAGLVLHVPVESQLHASGVETASHAWLAGASVAFALAFLRVPFHLYWRADAALLAQLPIPGAALLDAALVRCMRAAAATTLTALIAAAPLAHASGELFARHALVAGVLGLCAAGLLPAIALWAASLVASGGGARAVHVATALASGSARGAVSAATRQPQASSGAILGALPGFGASLVFVVIVLAHGWLDAGASFLSAAPELVGLAAASIFAFAATRAALPPMMGTILRDVSALDRQRLAALEIRPPTGIERTVASLLGAAGLAYRKDARLMRRRYPMAYALGALAFLVLAIVGLSQPADPTPWLVITLAGAALYAIALGGRLRRAPIELARLSATLPITASARARAKAAWLAVWLTLFVIVPAAFALARGGL